MQKKVSRYIETPETDMAINRIHLNESHLCYYTQFDCRVMWSNVTQWGFFFLSTSIWGCEQTTGGRDYIAQATAFLVIKFLFILFGSEKCQWWAVTWSLPLPKCLLIKDTWATSATWNTEKVVNILQLYDHRTLRIHDLNMKQTQAMVIFYVSCCWWTLTH